MYCVVSLHVCLPNVLFALSCLVASTMYGSENSYKEVLVGGSSRFGASLTSFLSLLVIASHAD